jgi:integrase
MAASSRSDRRRRVARGIYQQPNGRYAVCVMVDRQPRFRTLSATAIDEARRQRELLQSIARMGELPVSPRLTFAEVAARWLAEFEAKVAASERRDRTLDLYRSQLSHHLLPRFDRRRLALITTDDVVAVMRELQAEGLSPWTIKRILGALSCVFTFALRRGYIASHPFHRLERDERPHPLRSDQRVLTRTELARLFAACPHPYRPLLLNVSKRVLRRAATGAGLDRPGRRVRFHDLRHTFASHLIIDIRLDVAQVSRILGHARTSMTLDTYTHLFEEARHAADVRAVLAKSDFAKLLAVPVRPRLRASEGLGSTRAAAPRARMNTPQRRHRCAPRTPSQRRCLLDQNLTNEIRQQTRQRV